MAVYQGFLGPSNYERSRNLDGERAINQFLQVETTGTPRVKVGSFKRPGLKPFTILGAGPVRGILMETATDRAFAVGGSTVYEIKRNHTATPIGTVAFDTNLVGFISNGTNGQQVALSSGGRLYVLDLELNTFTEATLDFTIGACPLVFVDGYALALDGVSNTVRFSKLYDFTEWPARFVFDTSMTTNNIVSLAVSHREVYLFGNTTTEVWSNQGTTTSNVRFAPVGGVIIESGIAGPWLPAILDNTLYYVGQDARGGGMGFRLAGYTPNKSSSHAVDFWLQTVSDLNEARGLSFQLDGHAFYMVNVPNADRTLLIDVASQSWTEWMRWNSRYARFEPFVGQCHAYCFGKHLVGDANSGVIYDMSLDYYTDRFVP